MSEPRVAIVVLNWNGASVIKECLKSLRRVEYQNVHVILVDNGSTDNSVQESLLEYPSIEVVHNQENLGFAKGNNIGLAHARNVGADYTLLLNNDTVVAKDFLSEMIKVTQSVRSVAALGPTIYYHKQPETIWSAGGEIDWIRGRTQMIGIGQKESGQFGDQARSVDFVTGCALLVSMDIVQDIGGLDPRFFAYFEEVEWCVRMARAGGSILHVPSAKIWHKITPEARESSPIVHYYMTRNRLLFLRLTEAGLSSWFYTLVLDYLRTLVTWTLRPRWRSKGPQRKAMLRALVDFSRGRYGKMAEA